MQKHEKFTDTLSAEGKMSYASYMENSMTFSTFTEPSKYNHQILLFRLYAKVTTELSEVV